MLMICKCPKHNKNLVYWKDTSTHKIFKCPECDYTGKGVVHHDLPERYNRLVERIKELEVGIECAIEDLKAWHCLSDDIQKCNIERFVKDFENTLKGE